jgi:hypothetical protein
MGVDVPNSEAEQFMPVDEPQNFIVPGDSRLW